jgi:ketosteroid isomerase-like protein
MNSKLLTSAACLALSATCLPAARAADNFSSALEARYRAVESAIVARDAKAFFNALYSQDIVVAGEGSASVIRGREALMPVIAEIVKTTRSCSVKGSPPARTAQNLGYSFVTYTCRAEDANAPDYQVRALYVWQRERTGWRVVAEMYQNGSM